MSSTHMMDQAMGYLSQGCCSENLLCAYLEKEFKNEPNLQERIQETICRLHHLDLINDAHIARRLAQGFSHKGDNFIRKQLEELGIKNEHIQSAIVFIGSEYQRAFEEARVKRLSLGNVPLPELQTQLMRLLSSRSFSYHTVRRVLDDLFNSDEAINPFWAIQPGRGESLFAVL